MSIKRHNGVLTLGGHVFWTDIANEHGWRVQFNRPLGAVGINRYRLIGPNNVLWASASSATELAEALPELIGEFSERDPLFGPKEAKAAAAALGMALLAVLRAFGSSYARERGKDYAREDDD